jgi:hypothetical protein
MTDTQEKYKATPEDYQLIFEDHKVGQKIFEDLLIRFGNLPPKQGGLDRVLNQFEYAGQRRVIDYIALRLDQANGVRSNGATIELETD